MSQKARVVQEAGAICDHQRDGSNTRGERLKFHEAVLRACVVFCQPWVADDFITDPNVFSLITLVCIALLVGTMQTAALPPRARKR